MAVMPAGRLREGVIFWGVEIGADDGGERVGLNLSAMLLHGSPPLSVEASARRAAPPAPGATQLGQRARGVVSLHLRTLAREGRMTVTIGRRELLAALGGAAAA